MSNTVILSLGIIFGAAAGIALQNIGVGIAIGFALGAAFCEISKRRKK